MRAESIAEVHTARYGRGRQRFVAVHGWSGDHRVFEPLLPWLPGGAAILSLDSPGSGRSAPPRSWTLAGLAQPIVDLLEREDMEQATLIGNCAGAVICLEVAHRSPRVGRLVLIDPFAYAPWYFALLASRVLGRIAYWLTFENPVGRAIGNTVLASKRAADTDLFAGFASVRHREAWSFLRVLCTEARIDRYARLALPIDVIHGQRTFEAVRRSVGIMRSMWPDRCRVYQVEDAGHLPIQESPQAVAAIAFLGPRNAREGTWSTRSLSASLIR